MGRCYMNLKWNLNCNSTAGGQEASRIPICNKFKPSPGFSFYWPFGKLSFCPAPGESVYENCHYKSVWGMGWRTISEINFSSAQLPKLLKVMFENGSICTSYLTSSSIRCICQNFRNKYVAKLNTYLHKTSFLIIMHSSFIII